MPIKKMECGMKEEKEFIFFELTKQKAWPIRTRGIGNAVMLVTEKTARKMKVQLDECIVAMDNKE